MTIPDAAELRLPGPAAGQTQLAVLGFPAAHSLSPVIHRRAFELVGLRDWSYGIVELRPPELAEFLERLDASWRGFSVTMPLKQTIADIGSPDSLVERTGVANTLVIDRTDDGPQYRVYNTDVGGFVRAISSLDAPASAFVIGSGATALSAMVALGSLGARVTISARNTEKAERLAALGSSWGIESGVAAWGQYPTCAAVVSTIPADPAGLVRGLDVNAIIDTRPELVFDVVYHPWPTPLAAAADSMGIRVLSGLDLLVHQATAQFALFTGHTVAPEPLLLAVRSAVAARRPA